jgi:hypothetical protein
MESYSTPQILRGPDAISQTPNTWGAPFKGRLDLWIENWRDLEVFEAADGPNDVDSPEHSRQLVYDKG